jgi:hypothetical protein
MKTFLVSYDLHKPETSADYEDLIRAIKSYDNWMKPFFSEWFIKSNRPAADVMAHLRKHIDANDNLLVIEVTRTDWAGYLDKKTLEWMQANI